MRDRVESLALQMPASGDPPSLPELVFGQADMHTPPSNVPTGIAVVAPPRKLMHVVVAPLRSGQFLRMQSMSAQQFASRAHALASFVPIVHKHVLHAGAMPFIVAVFVCIMHMATDGPPPEPPPPVPAFAPPVPPVPAPVPAPV